MNATPWRMLFTGNRRGASNMAIDAAILKSVEDRSSPPTLRLYGWEPWCVSLGYFQNPVQELDAAVMRERGWDFVLRPTGGRAVLHAEEITYSLIARRDELPWCATLAESHARIAHAWAEALKNFNLHFSKGQSLEKPEPGKVGLPCFASTSRSELTFGERKVAGSAQRRTREAFLQHGSIPLTPAHERLVEALRLTEGQRQSYLEALRRHAISLGEIRVLAGDMGKEQPQLAKRLLEGLEIEAETGSLTRDESSAIHALEMTHWERQKDFFKTADGVMNPSRS